MSINQSTVHLLDTSSWHIHEWGVSFDRLIDRKERPSWHRDFWLFRMETIFIILEMSRGTFQHQNFQNRMGRSSSRQPIDWLIDLVFIAFRRSVDWLIDWFFISSMLNKYMLHFVLAIHQTTRAIRQHQSHLGGRGGHGVQPDGQAELPDEGGSGWAREDRRGRGHSLVRRPRLVRKVLWPCHGEVGEAAAAIW